MVVSSWHGFLICNGRGNRLAIKAEHRRVRIRPWGIWPRFAAVLSATTFCSFVREFSSLEVYARWTRNVLIGRVRGPCDCIRSHSLVRAQVPRGRADFVSHMALAAYFSSGRVRLADGVRATQIENQSSVTHQDSEQLNRFLGMSSLNRFRSTQQCFGLLTSRAAKDQTLTRGGGHRPTRRNGHRREARPAFFLARCSES